MKTCWLIKKILVVAAVFAGVAVGEESISEMLEQKAELKKQVDAVNKEYEPQLKPLQDQLQKLRNEMREKTKGQNERMRKLEEQIAAEFKKFLPSGEQSYGNFTWDCHAGSWINVRAKNADEKQMVWVQVFYRPEITPEKQKSYGNKTCCGFPAKRYEDTRVWIQCGKTEMRFGLSDKSLESDEILDAIVGSFDLEAISKL